MKTASLTFSCILWRGVTMRAAIALIGMAYLTGCASIGATYDEDKLIETASFDLACKKDQIRVVSASDGGWSGTGNFSLVACGKPVKYKRIGLMYEKS